MTRSGNTYPSSLSELSISDERARFTAASLERVDELASGQTVLELAEWRSQIIWQPDLSS